MRTIKFVSAFIFILAMALSAFAQVPTRLHVAVMQGDADRVKQLLAEGAYINAVDDMGDTPLHMSIVYDNTEIAKILIDAGANVNAKDDEGYTPLHMTAIFGRNNIFDSMMKVESLNVNLQDNRGYGALHFAAAKERAHIYEILVARKDINLNLKNQEGNTPLHVAAIWDSGRAARILVIAGADLSIRNNCFRTPKNIGKDKPNFMKGYEEGVKVLREKHRRELQKIAQERVMKQMEKRLHDDSLMRALKDKYYTSGTR